MGVRRCIYTLAWALILSAGIVLGQVTTGIISGTVSDPTGAVIPGATVLLKNVETGIQHTASTDASGHYRVPELGLGNYEVDVQATGFQSVERTGIALSVGREAVVNVVLQVGAVAEKITVTGEAPLVNTTNATVTTLVDEKAMRDLPLNGRSLADLTAIQPGVVSDLPGLVPGAQAIFVGGGAAARHSIGGTEPQQSSYLLDGIEITTPSEGMPVNSVLGQQLGVDAIREFTVLQSNFGAQYGRAAGGVVNAVTQSGTNKFHGTAFEFLRNDVLDARGFFLPPTQQKPPLRRNQFGGSLGGPIEKDRTFFFVNYEGVRQSAAESFTGTSLTAETRQGNITGCPSGRVSCSPAERIVTQTVPVDPNVVPIMNLLPLPNGAYRGSGVGEFSSTPPWWAGENYGMARIDQQLSSKDSLFGRITIDRSNRRDLVNPLFPAGLWDYQTGGYVVAALSETRVISPSLLNSLRIGFTRRNDRLLYNYTQGGDQFPNAPGLDPRLAPVRGVPISNYTVPGAAMYATGSGSVGPALNGPAAFIDNTFDYGDSLLLNHGRHSITIGGNVKRYQENELLEPWVYGQLRWDTIQNFLADNPLSDTQVLGFTNPNTQAGDVYRGWRQTYGALFVQDDFKVLPTLTVNLGVRWEQISSPREINGKLAVVKNLLSDPRLTLLKKGDPLFTQRDALHGFSPRIGFAWNPFADQKTIFRGGFGTFEELPLEYIYQSAIDAPPYSQRFVVNRPQLKFPFPFADPNAALSSGEPILMPADMKVPYTMQWTFSLERQLGSTFVVKANYIGLRTVDLFTVYNPNQRPTIVVNGRQFTPADAPVPNPNFTSFRYVAPISGQAYNALQLVVEKRLSHGLRMNASYTFARNIDNGGGSGVKGAEVIGPLVLSNGNDLRADRGLSSLNIEHNLILSGTYELPFGPGRYWGAQWRGLQKQFVAGWALNATSVIRSGLPVTLTMTPKQDRCSAQTCSERPDLNSGGNNNPVLSNWTPGSYFDPSQFTVPALGFFGNLGRNTLIAPGQANLNFSLAKQNRIGETRNLEFRAEFFNLFNHPSFGPPAGNVFSDAAGHLDPNAGRITATSTTMRQIQFGLKFIF